MHKQQTGSDKTTGFTLLELMVAITVAAILLTAGVPAFRHMTLSSRLTSTANQMVAALNMARMAAIKRDDTSQFCSNSSAANGAHELGQACKTQTAAVYTMVSTRAEQILSPLHLEPHGLMLHGDVTAIQFNGMGLGHATGESGPYSGVVADICSPAIHTDNHRVIRLVTGAIIEVDHQDGACT